jgi:hypothetical protein
MTKGIVQQGEDEVALDGTYKNVPQACRWTRQGPAVHEKERKYYMKNVLADQPRSHIPRGMRHFFPQAILWLQSSSSKCMHTLAHLKPGLAGTILPLCARIY